MLGRLLKWTVIAKLVGWWRQRNTRTDDKPGGER